MYRIFRLLLFAFCFLIFLNGLAQKTTISGTIENNRFTQADLLLLYKDDGISYGKTIINSDGSFKLTANLSKTDLYKLVFEEGQQLMMCLSPNQNIEIKLDGINLQNIISVKGSPSLEFCKKTSEMYTSANTLIDSLNRALQADKDVQFYNEFQSQFKPFFDANTETDAYCMQVVKITDSLQQYVNSKVLKGKVDPKETDAFIYTSSNLMKELEAKFTKFSNYVNSMSLFYDFKNNRNQKFEGFYKEGVDKYLGYLDQRNETMRNAFADLTQNMEHYLQLRDSLVINDLADKKKEKELLVSKIIELANVCSNLNETERSLATFARGADGFGKVSLQDAERKVSATVKKYQTFFDTENKRRGDAVVNSLLANKNDLAVLLFLDLFPRDQYLALHQEVIKALHEKYPDHLLVSERYKIESSPANATSVGGAAPDLAFENPDGKILKLSDLKGKVVLLDFWAGWCRPCRMENPNVVNLYKKYNTKGFEVYSVSLDRDKTSWLKAIQDDGLIWPYHVSDLKQWQSQAAKIYGVTAIPCTFLIDKNGKILAKNLRGAALENALKEIFD